METGIEITEELKNEVQYLAEFNLREFTNKPILTEVSMWDHILKINIEPFRGEILIYELDKSLHNTPMRKWTHDTSCDLTPCGGSNFGGSNFGRQSRYSVMDTIQIAMTDLMYQADEALEDLPTGYLMSDIIKHYKIKNIKSGMYSTGGLYPGFNKTGKVWKSRNALMIHLSQFCRQYNGIENPYKDDAFVIEEEIFEKTSSSVSNLDTEINRLKSLHEKKRK